MPASIVNVICRNINWQLSVGKNQNTIAIIMQKYSIKLDSCFIVFYKMLAMLFVIT